jgi:hypothetical protein
VTERENCSVSVALSLISFGFLNYAMRMRRAGRIDSSNDCSRSAPATPVKRTCHKTNAPTNRHTEGAGGSGEEREREREVGRYIK